MLWIVLAGISLSIGAVFGLTFAALVGYGDGNTLYQPFRALLVFVLVTLFFVPFIICGLIISPFYALFTHKSR